MRITPVSAQGQLTEACGHTFTSLHRSGFKQTMRDSFVSDLKAQSCIVEVAKFIGISDATYSKNIKCPLHNDSNPSFRFYEGSNGGSFKCFSGCNDGKGNDVFSLVMLYQGVEFWESVKVVAQATGTPLPEPKEAQQPDHLKPLKSSLRSAYKLFSDCFEFSPALSYLRSRSFSEETLTKFEIGYAPNGNRLFKYAKSSRDELLELGLLTKKEDSDVPFDLLRNRAIFPIHNHKGLLVGFAGRALEADVKPKYLNSPESAMFKKSELLYNLHRIPRSSEEVVVCEGYTDVMGMDQAGIGNTVCTMGCSLSEFHLDLLIGRFSTITFMFDGDRAGFKAAWRTAQTVIKRASSEVSFKFCFLPDNLDPFDFVAAYGTEAMLNMLENALFLSDFILQQVARSNNAKQSIEARCKLHKDLSEFISLAPQGLFRDQLAMECAAITGTFAVPNTYSHISGSPDLLAEISRELSEKYGDQIQIELKDDGVILKDAAVTSA